MEAEGNKDNNQANHKSSQVFFIMMKIHNFKRIVLSNINTVSPESSNTIVQGLIIDPLSVKPISYRPNKECN